MDGRTHGRWPGDCAYPPTALPGSNHLWYNINRRYATLTSHRIPSDTLSAPADSVDLHTEFTSFWNHMGTSTCGENSPLPEIAFSPDTQPDLDPACKWLKGCRITKCPLRYICRFIFFQRADGNSVPGGREGGEGVGSTETFELEDVADEGRGRGVLDPHSARNENDTLTG